MVAAGAGIAGQLLVGAALDVLSHGPYVAAHQQFGQFPITLKPKQAFVLRAMAVASDDPNPLNEIASLLEEHGSIRLWAESGAEEREGKEE